MLFPGLLPRKGVEEVISEALLIITTYYYTMLLQLLLHCYFMFYINCWLFLFLCFKTRRKMLVFDRPSFLPLLRISVFQSTIYSLFFPLIQCIMLSSGRKTHGYARYSPLLYSPLFVLPDRPLQSTLDPWSKSAPGATTTTLSSPQTRSSFGGSQAGGLAFSICISDVICASLLKAKPD